MMRSPVGSSVGPSFDSSFSRSALFASPLGADRAPASGLGARVARQMVALCMFCGSARVPARTADAADRWAPLPPAVHERIAAGTSGLVVSHGLCPACARVHYPELF